MAVEAVITYSGSGSFPSCWSWHGFTPDRNPIRVDYYWGWNLEIAELIPEDQLKYYNGRDRIWKILVRNNRKLAIDGFLTLSVKEPV